MAALERFKAAEPGGWIGTWTLVDWLLDEEAQDVVLPCHSLAGEWAPGRRASS